MTGLRVLLIVVCLAGLAVPAQAKDEKSIAGFTKAMLEMAPGIDPAEAAQVSLISHRESRRLAKEYRVVGPSVFQNFLIHVGARKKGFCFHWARDIGAKLRELPLETLELHWGAADAGTRLEHNVVIVTARGQSIYQGYVIDGWRNAGRLCWWPVWKDRFRWKEDRAETAWLQKSGPIPATAAR